MKIAALHLLAFGPFTDKSIALDDGPANLHLIYGPNEAGKSSALRAMGELRFGIQLRSTDDFLHPYDRMLVGGAFIDAAGERVELLRSKGRNKTLSYMDPATRLADAARPMNGEHEQALTGGLSRSDFSAMFGLNHERLREGGRQLVRGDGELGSALFEASAGTRGIAAVLASLEDDAKLLFSSRGAAKNPTLNDAGKQFEEARKAYREALVKPADWQQRKRAHDEARAALDALHEALVAERRRVNELTELRTVEPLLRQLDLATADLEQLADVPLLAESARDERLAAEPALLRARQDAAAAAILVEDSTRALAALHVEPALIAHAAAIERFVIGVEAASRGQVEVLRLQAGIDRAEADLMTAARQIAGKGALPADVLEAVPSQAEQRALNVHFSALESLSIRAALLRQQASDVTAQLAQAAEGRAGFVRDETLRTAVFEALQRAQSLGDVAKRLSDTDRQRRELMYQIAQSLSDMDSTVGLSIPMDDDSPRYQAPIGERGLQKLRRIREAKPLLYGEIEAVRLTAELLDSRRSNLTEEQDALQVDIDVQRQRLIVLAAAGEIATADMLKETRARRDEMWARIRAEYVDGVGHVVGEQLLLDAGGRAAASPAAANSASAFESVLGDADRQADLLRADASRAAVFEECKLRIEQMLARQAEQTRSQLKYEEEHRENVDGWTNRLRLAGLPTALSPSALAEWQALRKDLIDRDDRLNGLHADRDLVLSSVSAAVQGLEDALAGAVADPSTRQRPAASLTAREVAESDMVELGNLMRRAQAWEATAAKNAAEDDARLKTLSAQREALARARAAIAEAESEKAVHRDAVAAWAARAFLAPSSTPEICRARMSELLELQARAADSAQQRQRRDEQAAIGADALMQAAHVAGLVGDAVPGPDSLRDYADALGRRLKTNLAAEHERDQLERDRQRGEAGQRVAALAVARHLATLSRLCAAARVQDADDLAAVEEAASRKRRAQADVERQRSLLAQASARSLEDLKQRLDGQDTVALDGNIERCKSRIDELEAQHAAVRVTEERTRLELDAIDSSDLAAQWRERMEQAGAKCRGAVLPWARLKLAHALLQESLRRFRDRAQAPMVQAASRYFALMTGGLYTRLLASEDDGKPVLQAERASGARISIDAMSEGTGDQLYLALRLAALELRRASHPAMPLVLDDVLITSDDERAAHILKALAEFAQGTQVLLFTHHRHVLDVGRAALPPERLAIHEL